MDAGANIYIGCRGHFSDDCIFTSVMDHFILPRIGTIVLDYTVGVGITRKRFGKEVQRRVFKYMEWRGNCGRIRDSFLLQDSFGLRRLCANGSAFFINF